jgi:hypothetical protein
MHCHKCDAGRKRGEPSIVLETLGWQTRDLKPREPSGPDARKRSRTRSVERLSHGSDVPSESGPSPGKAHGRIASKSGSSGSGKSLPRMGTDTQLATLLRLYREQGLEPEAIDGLGPLPPSASRAMRQLHAFLALCFGLRLADGTDGPMMLACSVLVHEGIVRTKPGASYLLHEAERLGIIWSPGAMEPLANGDGTRLFLPGANPDGPEPPGGWLKAEYRVLPRISDGVPGSTLEASSVAVEAEDIKRDVAVKPSAETPHESGMGDAVRQVPAAGRAFGLDGVTAVRDSAVGTTRSAGHAADDNQPVGEQTALDVRPALASDEGDPPWHDEFLRRSGGGQ